MGTAMPAIYAISAMLSTAMAVKGAIDQKKAADEAKDLANKNAKYAKMEAEEMARRAEANANRMESKAKAQLAAKGGEGGSGSIYLSELAKVNTDEIAWIRKAGASRASIEKQSGKVGYYQGIAGMWSSLGSAVGSAAGAAGRVADMNWTTTPTYNSSGYITNDYARLGM
jgi:hypothetical protein